MISMTTTVMKFSKGQQCMERKFRTKVPKTSNNNDMVLVTLNVYSRTFKVNTENKQD